jgi:hypothetical protein
MGPGGACARHWAGAQAAVGRGRFVADVTALVSVLAR